MNKNVRQRRYREHDSDDMTVNEQNYRQMHKMTSNEQTAFQKPEWEPMNQMTSNKQIDRQMHTMTAKRTKWPPSMTTNEQNDHQMNKNDHQMNKNDRHEQDAS